jgi:hypothetical protein
MMREILSWAMTARAWSASGGDSARLRSKKLRTLCSAWWVSADASSSSSSIFSFEPAHHVAVVREQRLGRRVFVAELPQPRGEDFLVRQRVVTHPSRESLVLDFVDPAQFGSSSQFTCGKRRSNSSSSTMPSKVASMPLRIICCKSWRDCPTSLATRDRGRR